MIQYHYTIPIKIEIGDIINNKIEVNRKKNIERFIVFSIAIVFIIVFLLIFNNFSFSSNQVKLHNIDLKVGDVYNLDSKDGILWSTSDIEVATISDNGEVIAISTGIVTIIGKKDNKILYKYNISIEKNESIDSTKVNSISFKTNNIPLMVGDSYKSELSIDPNNYDIKKLTWSSSDKKVVTVKNGIITAVGKGTADVTVTTSSGLSAICKIIVNESTDIKSIKFSEMNKTIYVGEKYQTKIFFEPSSLTTKVSYKSSNEKIATVSSDGLITGKKDGSVEINATVNNLTTKINIKVFKSTDKIVNVKFEKNGASKISSSSDKCTSRGNGCTVKLPKITRDGYTIVGWSKNANATSAEYKAGDKITVYGNTTYYAITYKKVETKFKPNGSSINDTTKTCKIYNKKESCKILTPNIIRTGYNIIGWGTSSNSTSKSVSSNTEISLKNNITYYAVTSKVLTANFDSNGATSSHNKKECIFYNTASSCEVTAPTITRNGYTIVGWATNSNSTSKSLGIGEKVKLSKNATYYAVTSKNITAKFEANKSSISKTSASCTLYNKVTSCSVTSPTISRSNYSVLGWGISSNSSSAVAKQNTNIPISTSSTYYAITKINKDGIEAGCTGWMAATTYYYSSANTSSTKNKISVGTAFTIEGVQGDFFKVSIPGVSGYKYIQHKYIMINLADYIPSMVFQISNANSSIYKSSGYNIPNVTGTKLYAGGKVYNVRLRKNEYMAPVLYSVAKKLLIAQKSFLSKGYTIKVYDVYRPYSVSTKIYTALTNLYNSNQTVKNNILYSYGASGTRYQWDKGWFLASSVSTHNTGAAIDMTLANKSNGVEVSMPTAMHELSTKAIKYYSPNVSNVPANYSKEMNANAKLMDSVVTSAGLTPLASEWWHFQDSSSHNLIKGLSSTGCNFSVTKVYSY